MLDVAVLPSKINNNNWNDVKNNNNKDTTVVRVR